MKTQISLAVLLTMFGLVATGCSQPFWSKKADSDPFADAVQGRDLSPKPKQETGFLQSLNPFSSKPKSNITQSPQRNLDPSEKREQTPEDKKTQELALARVLERKDDYTRALNQYRELEKKYPNDPTVHHRLGIMAAKETQWPEAEQRLHRALELGGSRVEILSDLGYLYYLQGKYDPALKALDSALQLDVRHEKSLVNKGLVLGEMGRFKDAEQVFMKALDRGPAHANMGYVYSQLGDLESAKASYLKSLDYDPKNSAVVEALIQIDAGVKLLAKKEQEFKENKINGQLTPGGNSVPQYDNRTHQNQPADAYSQRPLGTPQQMQNQMPPQQQFANTPANYPPNSAYPTTQHPQAHQSPAAVAAGNPPPLSSVAAGLAPSANPSHASGHVNANPSSPAVRTTPSSPSNYVQAPFGTGAASISATDAAPARAEQLGLTDPPLDDISEPVVSADVATNNTVAQPNEDVDAAGTLPSPEETVEIVDVPRSDPSVRWRTPRIPGDGGQVATHEPVYREPAEPRSLAAETVEAATAKSSNPSNPSTSLVEIVDNAPSKPNALVKVEDMKGVTTGYQPRQATSTTNQANSSMMAGVQNSMRSGMIAQNNASPAQSVGTPVPVYYGPKKDVETVEETTVGRRDPFADLKRQVESQKVASNQANTANNAELTNQSAARPAGATPTGATPSATQGEYGSVATANATLSPYGQPHPATTVSQESELPPVLTPSEYYARQLPHNAAAAQAGATQVNTYGLHPNVPAHPSTQTYQPHPQMSNGYGQQAQAEQAAQNISNQNNVNQTNSNPESQPAASQASRGLLPNIGLPSWLKR